MKARVLALCSRRMSIGKMVALPKDGDMPAAKKIVHTFTAGENVIRPRQSTDYLENFSARPEVPIVIDNGSYHCRVGWATEAEPRYDFRNLLSKPRTKATGQSVNIVGEYDATTAKAFDFSRSSVRSAFDGNVVYQFETMEVILDYAFDRLGIDGGSVDHPLLITECPCNPLFSRSKMAELAFEAYGAPSIAFGVDSVLAHAYNRARGRCGGDGLLVAVGHATIHVIPMVGGEPLMEAACRTPVGGFHCTDFLKRLLTLHYPQHAAGLSWERVEQMKQRHCYVPEDYQQELRVFQAKGKEAQQKIATWQLPWVAPPEPEAPSQEELARKAAVKERSGQRLRDMAAAKRAAKIADLERQVAALEQLQAELEEASEKMALGVLSEAGFRSQQELQAQLAKQSVALRKARGEPVEEEAEKTEEVPDSEKYPLLDIPDQELTQEQVKEKRKQRLLKNSAEGRARAKQRKEEERVRLEQERQLEEERRLANPEAYLEELRAKFTALHEKREHRKRRKLGGGAPGAGGTGGSLVSAPSGRGERLTAAHRERMKLLTTAAFDSGKGEDTFGTKDSDWQLYKQMGREEEGEEEIEAEEAEFSRTVARLQELDATFVVPGGVVGGPGGASQGQEPAPYRRPIDEDYQIPLGVERIRAAEIVFQPSIIAVDQAGLGEMLSVALRRTPPEYRQRVANGEVFLTGGSSLLAGLDSRVWAELRKTRPLGAESKVVRAYDPVLDAWHGAAEFARLDEFKRDSFSKSDYEERGADWLRKYSLQYSALR